MTQKELLYLEDAIGHEKNIIAILENSLDYINDDSLINYFKNQIKKHEAMKKKLMSKLEDKSNE